MVTKSIGPEPRDGHPNPTVVVLDGALLNAMGLPNPGAEAYGEELAWLRERDPRPVIVSVFGVGPEEYASVATALEPWADAFELNLSCPHAKGLGAEIGSDPGRLEEVVRAVVHATGRPVFAKLTPNTSDVPALARAAERGGASGLVAINTLRAMVVDLELGRPALANVLGGLSGPAIRPVGVRCVHEACQAASIPVVGVGGIERAEDALEYFMAGATAVGVGTAVSRHGPGVFAEIASGLERWLEGHGYTALDQVRGVVGGGEGP